MTLRISPIPGDDRGILRLEGRLGPDEVPALERAAREGVPELDLTDLLSASEEGLAALRRLRDRGVALRNPSHYFALLLG